jgi:HEPN domain-containing protein
MKALLQRQNVRFEKIHDLLALKELCLAFVPELEFHQESLAYLSQFAVAFRYPGESASREQAKRAVKIMKEIRIILRTVLGVAKD